MPTPTTAAALAAQAEAIAGARLRAGLPPKPKVRYWALVIKLQDELTVTLHSDEDDAFDTLRATFAHMLDAETPNEHLIDALENQYNGKIADDYFMASITECEVK